MSIEIKYKLGDLAKDLGAASKDIIEMLSALEKGEAKKHTTPLAENELNLVLEQMTNNAQEENFNAYFAMAAAAKKKEEKKAMKKNIRTNSCWDNDKFLTHAFSFFIILNDSHSHKSYEYSA